VSGKSIDQSCKAIEGSTFQKGEDGICLLLQNRMKDNEGEKAHSLDKVIMFQSTIFRACICFYFKQKNNGFKVFFLFVKVLAHLGV